MVANLFSRDMALIQLILFLQWNNLKILTLSNPDACRESMDDFGS